MAPFSGVTVLDFTHALAGPYCTMLMAAYGARVFKVEGPGQGDMGRTWGPPFLQGESAYFLGINSGKRSLTIDLKHPAGQDLCQRLAQQSDVLIENLRPGALERLGLGAAHLRSLHPRLIYCSISGYGQSGPSRDAAAMDLILQAASGLISVTGTAAGEVVRCGHSVADVTAGMFALTGILMALRHRDATGEGQHIDVSMFDSMISAMASNYAQYLGSGVVPGPLGTAFATIVPYACFPTADRPIAIAVASESLWERFCQALGQPGWFADPRLATNALRVENREWFEAELARLLRGHAAGHWIAILERAGIPCSPVNSLADVAGHPQAAHRGMFPVVEHPAAGPVRVTGLPIKIAEAGLPARAPAPMAGQHTRESLRELLALGDEELGNLEEMGVIRQHPGLRVDE